MAARTWRPTTVTICLRVTLGALNLVMPTSAAIGTTFDIGSIYSTGIDGTIGSLSALNLTVPTGGTYQAGLVRGLVQPSTC